MPLARGMAFYVVDEDGHCSHRWDQCGQQEDQWNGPWSTCEIGSQERGTDRVKDGDGQDLEDEPEQRGPALVGLVSVRESVCQLCSEPDDDESHD